MIKTLFIFIPLFIFISFSDQSERLVYVIEIEGTINPVSTDFIINSIETAEKKNAECLIIEMDTPGGLMKSMKSIVKEIFSSGVPVVVYISPSGSTSGSAGVFITLSAHIAAMAPGTNIGAAHPVTMGLMDTTSTMNEKIVNDAVSYIRSIAKQRNKNEIWAEKAVRESNSITEREAKKLNVIDYIAPSLDSLLVLIDGRKISLNTGTKILNTKNVKIIKKRYNWRYKLLDTISDPNIAYILLLIGIYGLVFELMNPGSILPGVVGGISIILAFFALQTLPINYAGLLLIIISIILFIVEIKVTSYGLLTIAGIISLTLGSIMLIESPLPYLKISWSVIVPAVIFTTLFFLFAVGLGLKAQMKKASTGKEGIVGMIGTARTDLDPEGQIFVAGELWKAYSDEKIKKGEKVKVIEMKELLLKVKKS
ncbi:nodulation protein NfeD [candidate division KSB1 bacterium]|nr:MAG: nodulation protein NfeD [candidate division KSB1 bacterium]